MSEESKAGEGTEQNQGPDDQGGSEIDPDQYISKDDHQKELNRLLAEDRRKHKEQHDSLKQTHDQMEQQLQQLLDGKSIDEVRDEIEATKSKLRSAEDQAKIDAARWQNKLKEAETGRDSAQTELKSYLISRQCLDAALLEDKAANSTAANLLAKILAIDYAADLDPETKKVFVEMEVEEDGVKAMKKLTPAEAIAQLELMPERYGPLFKSTQQSGTGQEGDGLTRKEGKIDASQISMEQYAKERAEKGRLATINQMS